MVSQFHEEGMVTFMVQMRKLTLRDVKQLVLRSGSKRRVEYPNSEVHM